ncbi:zinc transporter ZntB [Ferrimonas sediminicola]|uniref:Zinc transporter ZntB n=1 Tax=Ferrimonas sediminicola TaxID=2569538 RepID=A0A4U1BJ12_9GAMM|nr:zinc transporter ZntB [Ferrimonas sediminicola]TKB50519.1 zinc transporter ZntB [Ferrimonas sediminicola]
MKDSQGLIIGRRFDGQGGAQPLALADADDWGAGEESVWLHFDYTDEGARGWIEHHSGLERVAVDALLSEGSRPRATLLTDGLLLNLRGVNLSPGSDPEDMVGIRLWTDGRRILTTRKRQLLSVRDVADRWEQGDGPRNVGEFLVLLTGRLMARMQGTIDQTEELIDEIEEQMLSGAPPVLRSQIASVRRTVISLRRYLSPQREALQQLQTLRIVWLNQEDRQALREVADHLSRFIEGLDSVRERAVVAQEEQNNRLSEKMNKRMYVLSLVAAIFLPLGFLTGLLGVNVGGIPGANFRFSFWIFCGLLTALVGLQWWLFKRNRWL